jgi:cation diffusion facilitator CzcD-associated flavoprotein CzcO
MRLMSEQALPAEPALQTADHLDVLIVGAGMAGIGGAYHLARRFPGMLFAVLEAQESFGGTWITHRYPGIRSDSDLYTYGYSFKPWTGAPIATAGEILKYMAEVIEENGLGQYIRYHHKVTAATWSSEENLWTLRVTRTDTGEEVHFTAGFLWMCQGYYRHGEGYMPDWPGQERFDGRLVHTEAWPDDLDYRGKKVVVIGSGATAATLIPAMADACGHITMLQRSPTYFRTGRNAIEIADELRELGVRDDWIHDIVRRKIQYEQAKFARRTFTEPEVVTEELLAQARAFLGPDYDIKSHFTPRYRPWQQRMAFIPDGDLFRAIRDGKAAVVTDEIETFTETGIRTKSGTHLDADIIVAATGFHLSVLGDIAFCVDGEPLCFSDTVTYRGMMFTGVPNMAWVFGYFRASWTLRVDIVSDFVIRLLQHMQEVGARKVTVALGPEDEGMPVLPWTDPENFNPGYLVRGLHLLPRRGNKPKWQHTQDHWADVKAFAGIDLRDPVFVYA